jgi:hypothetical protein
MLQSSGTSLQVYPRASDHGSKAIDSRRIVVECTWYGLKHHPGGLYTVCIVTSRQQALRMELVGSPTEASRPLSDDTTRHSRVGSLLLLVSWSVAHHKALSSSHSFGEKVEKRKDERPQDQDGAATGWDGLGHPTDAQAI